MASTRAGSIHKTYAPPGGLGGGARGAVVVGPPVDSVEEAAGGKEPDAERCWGLIGFGQ